MLKFLAKEGIDNKLIQVRINSYISKRKSFMTINNFLMSSVYNGFTKLHASKLFINLTHKTYNLSLLEFIKFAS